MTLAIELAYWQQSVLRSLGVLAAVLLPAGTFVYVFLFKMVSFMQSRLGPMEAGPYGSMQLLAEVGKFLQKEDVVPDRADRHLFKLAPYLVVASVLLVYVVVPFGPDMVFIDNQFFGTGIFYVMAVSSISVIGILIAGWASASKYSLLGALRAAGQLIAYELPLVLSVVGVVIQAGTLDLQRIVVAQANGEIFGFSGIGNPYLLTQFVGLGIFMIAMQAELAQTPFDMPVAESELVTGYMTEYTGLRFLLFFIGEFATAGAFSAIAATLFLGGWYVPGLDLTAGYMNVVGPIVLLGKMMIFGGIIFFIRFSYPRFREDQLQRFAWKFLIPIALANILVTGVLKVVFEMPPKPKLPGVVSGLKVTLTEMFKPNVTVQYPREKEPPPTRARGVIALKEDNCTVCMLCARSCPDWCIYIEGHKEKAPPRRPGGKPRTVSALDRFDIDYALCMYCGICVEVCPFDALFWSPEFEYSEPRIADLLHDKERLGEWMETVPDFEPYESGSEVKVRKVPR